MPAAKRFEFERIAFQLADDIRSGRILNGAFLPTEEALREKFGVSRSTVRKALDELIAQGWGERMPKRGVSARRKASVVQTSMVAFVDNRDAIHRSLFFHLSGLLAARGLHLVHVDSQNNGTFAALVSAKEAGCVGAFVWPKMPFFPSEELAKLQKDLALVAVDHSLGGEPSELVMSDHFEGARMAVAHLIAQGRKRIAVTGYFTHHEDTMLRFAGYVAAHHYANQNPSSSDYLFSSPGAQSYEDPRLLQFRLGQIDRPDAVFCLYDMSVPVIEAAIVEMDFRVPEDVAIVGFGNDLPFTMGDVGLTTVGMNWQRVAETLVERMIHRIENPTSPFAKTIVPTRLIVRGSCGAARSEWSNEPYEVSSETVTGRMPHDDPSLESFRVMAVDRGTPLPRWFWNEAMVRDPFARNPGPCDKDLD